MNEEALAYKEQVLLEAQGEVARFNELLPQYTRAPQVTRERIYLETMEAVMSNTSKILIDNEGGNSMMYLPLDKMLERQGVSDARPRTDLQMLQSVGNADNARTPSSTSSMRADRTRTGR